MMRQLIVSRLCKEEFRPFGDVIETDGGEQIKINNGTTIRFHDLANVETRGEAARVLINIFRGEGFELPLKITMMERHPLGSQAFVPLDNRPFLVVVAEDVDGRPGTPRAFLCDGRQGVNYAVNVWHHPLVALEGESDFLVVDRGGSGNNLEEFIFDNPYVVSER